MADTRKLATATLLGVAIAVVKGPLQPPYADFLIIVEAPILGLSFLLLGRGGATYTELVNGLLQSFVKASFFPFSLVVALLYGAQVDFFGSLFRAGRGERVSSKRMMAALGLSSITTGVLAAYTSISLGLVQYVPSLLYVVYVPIIVWGVFSGFLGGFFATMIWERNLKARFRPLQRAVSQAS
jgi:hypothetical protein